MPERRIRRCFQFGVVDLLLLTTIAAVVVVLWRPPRITTCYEPLVEGTKPGQHWAGNGLRMKFRWCPPGEFKMGEPPNQADVTASRGFERGPKQVDVTLSRGFWLGKCEVTQGEYRQVMNDSPSSFPLEARDAALAAGVDVDKLPVEHVSWEDAGKFCQVLTEQERKAGRLPPGWEYRLPTEAQWEYACREGTQTRYSFGDDESRLGDFAWYHHNSRDQTHEFGQTHEVGQKLPNAWGLRDMHGNVREWCSDQYQETLVGGTDPEVTEPASRRVARGGVFHSAGGFCRSAVRSWGQPGKPIRVAYVNHYTGFRVALVQQAEPGERSESK